MPPITLTDATSALLTAVEAEAHEAGWTRSDRLYLLHHHEERDVDQERHYRALLDRYGKHITVGNQTARPWVSERALTDNAVHAVYRLALNLTASTPAADITRHHLYAAGYRGVALRFDAWRRDRSPGDDTSRAAEPDYYGDIPGSVQARCVIAADADGGRYRVTRTRGQGPVLDHPGTPTALIGAAYDALAVVSAVIAGAPIPAMTHTPAGWPRKDDSDPAAPRR